MLPLQSLLNPAPSNGRAPCLRQPASVVVSNSTPDATTASRGAMDAHLALRRRASRSATPLPKSKTQGPVRFPPFEVVDEATIQHITRYQISSFGQIQQCCEHIPYNSTKKDFYEKTGRESIEAFQYEFRIPGQQTTYKVMWDYNIGLVRMTPFFKCFGYGKTKPSQMLDKNPGLREISPSITGGSVSAQGTLGYWMPYRCARAVCATFCYEIAGALIPLFGPDFPSECTPPRFSDFAEMVISQQLVEEATLEAETSRDAYRTRKVTALNGPSGYPRFGSYRPVRNEDLHPYFRPPPLPMPAWTAADSSTGAYQPALRRESAPRNVFDMERAHPHGNGANTLPPINLPSREDRPPQLSPHAYGGNPQTRALTTPGAATDSWVFKRRRVDHEYSEDAYASARPKAARTGARAILHEEMGEKWRTPPARGADYAAAEVLVRLQKEDQELPTAATGSAADGSSLAEARRRIRHRANSY
ncbi:Transcriptional repressor XBP1 [Tolypocladium paradoxum]|uniref:Transcriptional repressor XBP1 n=1 Tax=Tolypocladium paradoxum TaxID=94208 RepID=A0A2S4LB14_9HYPO|nr:Transcriptional repressor XBP1 [Tolypocladium paradoxum]